jgi:hypothetical protein
MSKKHRFFIEVNVPNGPEGWKKLVNNEMRQAIEKLKSSVEELGGKVCIRY